MTAFKTVCVGLAGTGWAGRMHTQSYRDIHGMQCRLKTVCSLDNDLKDFAEEHHFEAYTSRFQDLLQDPELDVIDIVTPPALHADMIRQALSAGKHVICEKPVTGYFDREGLVSRGKTSGGMRMLESVCSTLKEMEGEINRSGKLFCYAENWIYSPPFSRMVELVTQKRTRLLVIDGQTGHKGSHAVHAPWWKYNGGGTLIRQGSHPISAALYLKQREKAALGEKFGIRSVLCDAARITGDWDACWKGALHTGAGDVEDWALLAVTFTDGTKAIISSGDIFLSQIYNTMQVFGNDAVYQCNMTPNDLLEVYWANDERGREIELMEKNDQNIGWQKALIREEIIRGYTDELQDFLECISEQRKPRSDFALAKLTIIVIYAAYLSAELGQAVSMEQWLPES